MLVFFVLTLYFSQKVYPIPYEMKRITLMLVTAAGLYTISLLFNTLDIIPRLGFKALLIFSFPFVLYLFRFYEPVELNRIRGGWNKWSKPSEFRENISRLTKK